MLSFQVDDETATKVDEAAKSAGKSRSAWLRDAIASALSPPAGRSGPPPEVMVVHSGVGPAVLEAVDPKKQRYLEHQAAATRRRR